MDKTCLVLLYHNFKRLGLDTDRLAGWTQDQKIVLLNTKYIARRKWAPKARKD